MLEKYFDNQNNSEKILKILLETGKNYKAFSYALKGNYIEIYDKYNNLLDEGESW